jgi:hypothetical protein
MSTFVDSSQAKDGVKAKRIRTWSASVQNLISLPLLAFVTIVVLLGVNFVAVRFSNAELPPFWGAALRFTIASVVLFMIVLFRRLPLPRGMGLVGASLYGLLTFGFTYAFVYWALLYVPSGMASVTFATIPLHYAVHGCLAQTGAADLARSAWRGPGADWDGYRLSGAAAGRCSPDSACSPYPGSDLWRAFRYRHQAFSQEPSHIHECRGDGGWCSSADCHLSRADETWHLPVLPET